MARTVKKTTTSTKIGAPLERVQKKVGKLPILAYPVFRTPAEKLPKFKAGQRVYIMENGKWDFALITNIRSVGVEKEGREGYAYLYTVQGKSKSIVTENFLRTKPGKEKPVSVKKKKIIRRKKKAN